MSAIAQVSRPASLNRRRRVRQKTHAPAYATFTGASHSEMLDFYEVLDISEVGVAVQCQEPMKVDQQVELCLDLAEASEPISATARVVWSDSTGRAGLALPALPPPALHRLREWLFLNAMAAAANAASAADPSAATPEPAVLRPDYTDTLTAASAVQREAESLGADLEAVRSLVASRSQSLLQASGAAIALTGKDDGTMVCRASAGPSAPPVGVTLQVGSGFSGECVRTGTTLRCDDANTDERVDRESCRALGIRSILAVPIRLGEKVIGLLEVFSAEPRAFGANHTAVLQRFAETILAAVNRALRAHDPSDPSPPSPGPFTPSPGSILFAHQPEQNVEKKDASGENRNDKTRIEDKGNKQDEDKVGGIRLPRVHLYLLVCVAATIALALGFILAPWIQEKLQARDRGAEHTVLASSKAPQSDATTLAGPALETATLDQLRQFAKTGDPAAEEALGLRYASGEGVARDDNEAAVWFTKAAENGNVKAQAALATRYWAGRGVPPSLSQAYFWTVLARAAGDKNSKIFAEFLASHMTRSQAAAIEQKANIWYQQHESSTKPDAGR
jgi:putative methionine-R-sulfoxide reductase with GAF domain